MKIKALLFLTVLYLGILPTYAKISGGVSQDFFYDTEKTIMTEIKPNQTIRTEKYWSTNVLSSNRYKPFFMLSNRDLFDLMPKENISVVQRITTPSVYNISLKTASIISVSLKPITQKKSNSVRPTQALPAKQVINVQPADLNMKYQQAKNPEADSDQKINTAISLKNSKKSSNYSMALDLLDDVTRMEPYNAYAFYLKGEIYSAQKDTEKAMENYVEAVKLNPINKPSYLGIAKILDQTNKPLAQKYYALAR